MANSVNSFIGSLPRFIKIRQYRVFINGSEHGSARAKNKHHAVEIVRRRFPDANIRVEYIGWCMVPPSRG